MIRRLRKEVRYLWQWGIAQPVFWWGWLRNPPVEWVDVNDGSVESEPWTRAQRMVLRPQYHGLLWKDDCGCSRRLGLWLVLVCMECPRHSPFGPVRRS